MNEVLMNKVRNRRRLGFRGKPFWYFYFWVVLYATSSLLSSATASQDHAMGLVNSATNNYAAIPCEVDIRSHTGCVASPGPDSDSPNNRYFEPYGMDTRAPDAICTVSALRELYGDQIESWEQDYLDMVLFEACRPQEMERVWAPIFGAAVETVNGLDHSFKNSGTSDKGFYQITESFYRCGDAPSYSPSINIKLAFTPFHPRSPASRYFQ